MQKARKSDDLGITLGITRSKEENYTINAPKSAGSSKVTTIKIYALTTMPFPRDAKLQRILTSSPQGRGTCRAEGTCRIGIAALHAIQALSHRQSQDGERHANRAEVETTIEALRAIVIDLRIQHQHRKLGGGIADGVAEQGAPHTAPLKVG